MRRVLIGLTVALTLALAAGESFAQRNRQRERDFVVARPAVGDALPSLEIYTPDGRPFSTADLRGHFTVLVFGCLT
jgi:cytochrome oxidase Cu insertion factor (SCO1/SenC/PrrC family)